jgi:hypothetical protein
MFGIKYNQRNIKRRITTALVLICLVVFTVDVQLYFEHQILANIVTCANKPNQRENYFNMSLPELMEVVVVSRSEEQPSSFLLNSNYYHSDRDQQSL